MSDNDSWNAGRWDGPRPASTNWDEYQQGKSIRDLNQQELARQAQAWNQPQHTTDSSSSIPIDSYGSSYGGSGGNSSTGGSLFLGLLTLLTMNWIFPLLYPFAAVVAAAAGVGGFLLVQQVNSADAIGSGPLSFLGVVTIVAFWAASRAEHRLAQRRGFRRARHVVRLALIALGAHGLLLQLELSGDFPPALQFLQPMLKSPDHAITLLVIVTAFHFVLARATGLRNRWHNILQSVYLRPKGYN